MRIRTDGEYEHRRETIEAAAEVWGCNKTEAILRSCMLATRMVDNLERAAQHPDMTDELADVLSTPNVEIQRELVTDVEIDD